MRSRRRPYRLAPVAVRALTNALGFFSCIAVLGTAGAETSPLKNVSLRCCVVQEKPYTMRRDPPISTGNDTQDLLRKSYPEIGNWSGLAIDTLVLLQHDLGFKCSSLTEYIRKEENLQGYSGFVDYMEMCSNGTELSSNCECDMGVGSWTTTSTRYTKVDFVAPFANDEYQVVTTVEKATGSRTNSFFFVSTFEWLVWLAIAGLFACHILVTALDVDFAQPGIGEGGDTYQRGSWIHRTKAKILKIPLLYKLRHAFFNSAYHLLGQAPHFFSVTKKGTKEKMLGMIALFMGVFLVTVYQASITVQVILSSPLPDFVSLRDFESCRIPANQTLLVKRSGSESFWYSAINRTSCHKEDITNVPLIIGQSDSVDPFAMILKGENGSMYYYSLAAKIKWAAEGDYCGKLAAVGDSFFQASVSFVLPRNSPYTDAMSSATLRIRELALIPSSRDYVEERKRCPPLKNPTLSWGRLSMFFYLAFGAEIFMLFMMLLDRIRISPDSQFGLNA